MFSTQKQMFGEKYIQALVLLLIHFIALIVLVFNSSGLLFRLEFALFIIMLFISLVFLFGLYFEEGWAFVLMMLFFGINLINAAGLAYYLPGNVALFTIVFLVDAIGFGIAIANTCEEEEDLEIE